MKKTDIDVYANSSVNLHEGKNSFVTDENLRPYYHFVINFFSSNTASSVQAENINANSAEKIKEDFEVLALERLVYSLLVDGHTKQAKEALEKFNYISSPLLNKWKNAFFRVPDIKPRKASLKKNEIEKEAKWLRENRDKYVSKWVALVAGDIVASADSLENLKKELKSHSHHGDVNFLKL